VETWKQETANFFGFKVSSDCSSLLFSSSTELLLRMVALAILLCVIWLILLASLNGLENENIQLTTFC